MPYQKRKLGSGASRYYYRYYRRNGKRYRQYIGTGEKAERAAAEDAEARKKQKANRQAAQEEHQVWRKAQLALERLIVTTSTLMQAMLVALGAEEHSREE